MLTGGFDFESFLSKLRDLRDVAGSQAQAHFNLGPWHVHASDGFSHWMLHLETGIAGSLMDRSKPDSARLCASVNARKAALSADQRAASAAVGESGTG